MERQKLDFPRPVLPERRSGQIASEAEKCSPPVENPRSIFFAWEKNSGWPKHENNSVNQNSEWPPILRMRLPHSADTFLSEEGNDESEGLNSKDEEEDEETDEWDSISRNVSFLENFRISGWSSLKKSDPDPQARDIMMRRFLRAAKAIASETPPHSSKNMHVICTEPKRATRTVKAARPTTPVPECRTDFGTDIEEYNEDDKNDEEDQRHISGQNCRFLVPMSCIWSPFRGHRRRAKLAYRPPAKRDRTLSTAVSKDTKRYTDNYGRFHGRTKLVPTGNSLFLQIKHSRKAKENKCVKTETLPAPQLPLPPSDSWLNRTLPSISSGNHLRQSYHSSTRPKQQCMKQGPEQQRVDPKWETMVKTYNLQRSHLPYSSPEMLPPISEV